VTLLLCSLVFSQQFCFWISGSCNT
jgi:hypothetical protein